MTPEESVVRGLLRRVIAIRHFGPGTHPGTGTDQTVHGGGGVEIAEEATPEGGRQGRGKIRRYTNARGDTYTLQTVYSPRGRPLAINVYAGDTTEGTPVNQFNYLADAVLWVGKQPKRMVERGGPGSGHFGHEGRPGEVGGSEPGDQVAMPSTDIAQLVTVTPEDIATGKVTISPEDALLGQPIQRIENTVYGTGYTTEDYLQLAQHVVDEQPEAFRQFMVQVEQALEDGTSTMEAYYDSETGEWTPERRLLHDQIVNDILEPGRPAPAGTEPEAIIMGGLPGSGKSSVLAERAASGQFDGYVHIDADIIKGMLPEYEGWNAALLHDESSAIVEQIFHRCTERHLPVMYDATLRSAASGEGIVNDLEAVGYNTRLIYVDVPIEESMRRVLSRFASGTGRYVSPFYVATHDGRNLLNWEALKGQVDAWEHWNNGQPQGQRPTLVAQGNRRQA